MKRRLGRRCSRRPTRRRKRRHGRNAILWRRWPTSFRRVRRRPRPAFAHRLQPARRLKRAPNRALSSLALNRAPPRCSRHRRRRRRTLPLPIKASPRWRIASKRRCASPMLRPKRAYLRRNRDKNRVKYNPLSRPRRPNHSPHHRRRHNRASHARPSRSRHAAHRRRSRPRAPRSTTISNRRWQVCWVAPQTRAE